MKVKFSVSTWFWFPVGYLSTVVCLSPYTGKGCFPTMARFAGVQMTTHNVSDLRLVFSCPQSIQFHLVSIYCNT